jgi:hypothetical protein
MTKQTVGQFHRTADERRRLQIVDASVPEIEFGIGRQKEQKRRKKKKKKANKAYREGRGKAICASAQFVRQIL